MLFRAMALAATAMFVLVGAARAQDVRSGQGAEEHERFELGGYGSLRYDRTDGPLRSALLLRRLVGEAEARVGRFHFETELELEGRGDAPASGLTEEATDSDVELELEQAWGSYAVSPSLSLRFGALLPPVGRMNDRNEDYLWNLPRRTLIDRTVPVLPGKAAWHSLGIGLVGERPVGRGARVRYQGYLLDDTEDELIVARGSSGTGLAAAEVHAGDDFVSRSGLPAAAAVRVALEHGAGSELALSGHVGRFGPAHVAHARSWTAGVDGRQSLGAVVIEAEALYARYTAVEPALAGLAQAAATQLTPTGAATEVELGGLAQTRSGYWLDVQRPGALPRLLGLSRAQLIPVARYERVSLGGAITGFRLENGQITDLQRGDSEQDRLTAGVAFRPLPTAVIQATVARSRALRGRLLDPGTDQHAVRAFSLGAAVAF